jgi:hypothetical protein
VHGNPPKASKTIILLAATKADLTAPLCPAEIGIEERAEQAETHSILKGDASCPVSIKVLSPSLPVFP